LVRSPVPVAITPTIIPRNPRFLGSMHDDRGEEILHTLIDRYLGDSNPKLASLLLARVEHETAIAIEPKALVSWDYRERMGGAV